MDKPLLKTVVLNYDLSHLDQEPRRGVNTLAQTFPSPLPIEEFIEGTLELGMAVDGFFSQIRTIPCFSSKLTYMMTF